MNLAGKVHAMKPGVRTAPWPGHELLRGYAVMALPFSSGYLLALRVWVQNDFAPYRSVWIRSPEGVWRMINDGPLLEATCPRYWGPAVPDARLGEVNLVWESPDELVVKMDQPRFVWRMRMGCPPFLRVMNMLHGALPLWTWKFDPLVGIREWMACEILEMGDIQFSFRAPSGQQALILPREIYFIRESRASLDGKDLGRPVRLSHNPVIGGVRLPTRSVFATGQSFVQIEDRQAYRRLRERSRAMTARRAGD